MFRTLLIQFFAICTALIMVVVSFEIYMRSQPEKFYSYGWAVSNIIRYQNR